VITSPVYQARGRDQVFPEITPRRKGSIVSLALFVIWIVLAAPTLFGAGLFASPAGFSGVCSPFHSWSTAALACASLESECPRSVGFPLPCPDTQAQTSRNGVCAPIEPSGSSEDTGIPGASSSCRQPFEALRGLE
jgi:hypothetical protein